MDVRQLSRETNVPIFVGNDADVAGLYEKWFGAARDLHDFIYVMVGEGWGLGSAQEPSLEAGAWLGFITLKSSQGKECLCGGRGCLETGLPSLSCWKRPQRLGRPLESVEQLSAALEEGTGLVKKFSMATPYYGNSCGQSDQHF